MPGKYYFTVRLNRIRVGDNKEIGKAEVQIMSFITAGNNSLPNLASYTDTNDEQQKKQIIKDAAKDMVSFREFIQVDNVRDDSVLTFGRTGVSVYTADFIPIDLNWQLTIIENDSRIRQGADIFLDIINSSEFDNFSTNLITLIAGATNPHLLIAAKIGKFLCDTVGKAVANNRDDQIGIFMESLNRFEHYLHGERKQDNVPGVVGNIAVDYTIFGTEY